MPFTQCLIQWYILASYHMNLSWLILKPWNVLDWEPSFNAFYLNFHLLYFLGVSFVTRQIQSNPLNRDWNAQQGLPWLLVLHGSRMDLKHILNFDLHTYHSFTTNNSFHVTNMQGNTKLVSLSQLILLETNCWKSTDEVEGSKVPTLYLLLTTKS